MPTLLNERTIASARKQHRCDTCSAFIEPGDGYHSQTYIYDDRVYDWRNCSACWDDEITNKVWLWCGRPDEGVCYEEALEWAREEAANSLPSALAFLNRAQGQAT